MGKNFLIIVAGVVLGLFLLQKYGGTVNPYLNEVKKTVDHFLNLPPPPTRTTARGGLEERGSIENEGAAAKIDVGKNTKPLDSLTETDRQQLQSLIANF